MSAPAAGPPPPAPRLAVVLATSGGFAPLRGTVGRLAAQTVRDAIELVLVAPSLAALDADDALLAPFARVVRVEAPAATSIGAANAAGVLRASAPVVALGEDHVFPAPDWAERLLDAHAGPWVAVAPVVGNANPGTAVSRADFAIGYAPWCEGSAGGDRDFLPGHNTSYKRAALVACGDRLPALLEAETLLHWEFRARGERLRLEPAARIEHANFSLWRSFLPAQYHGGRLFAGRRARSMPGWKRAVYVAGAPLIPIVRLVRLRRALAAAPDGGRIGSCLHALAAGLSLDALGQAVGYAFGTGDAGDRLARFEFERQRHVRADERRALWAA